MEPNKKRIAIYFSTDTENAYLCAEKFLTALSGYTEMIYLLNPAGVNHFKDLSCQAVGMIANDDCIPRMVGGICDLNDPIDEVIFCTDQALGPVYELSALFDSFDNSSAVHALVKENTDGRESFSSMFFAFSPRMLSPQAICDLLENAMRAAAIFPSDHEALKDNVFYYIDSPFLLQFSDSLLLDLPRQLLEQERCPLFSKSVFTREYKHVVDHSLGEPAYELFNALQNTDFDCSALLSDLIRNENQADFTKHLHLNYILPCSGTAKKTCSAKIALVMHLHYMDMLEDSLRYASAIPKNADVYITTNSDEKKEQIEKVFATLECHKLEIRTIKNRGRDVSSILVGVADVIFNYEYVCFVHDKKSVQMSVRMVGQSFAYMLMENMLCSSYYVESIIDLFEKEPFLGILSPPAPNHADYYSVLGSEWGGNFEISQDLAQKLAITVPMCKEKEPVAPLGTCFWFRPDAFKIFYDQQYDYEDFPPEPNGTDGTLLHAFERIYSFIPQQLGYFPATIMSDRYARIEIDNLRYYVRELNSAIAACWQFNAPLNLTLDKISAMGTHIQYLEKTIESLIPQTSIKTQLRIRFKKLFPKRLYGFIVRLKRFFFGPRHVGYSYNENPWEDHQS